MTINTSKTKTADRKPELGLLNVCGTNERLPRVNRFKALSDKKDRGTISCFNTLVPKPSAPQVGKLIDFEIKFL